MGINIWKQPDNNKKGNSTGKSFESFSDAVKYFMKIKKMTQVDLAEKSELPRTIISRICRNSNDRGSTYTPPIPVIIAVSVGLKLNHAEKEILLFAAYPQMKFWDMFIDKHMSIFDANVILVDNEIVPLGNIE